MARAPSKRSVYFQAPRLKLIAKEFSNPLLSIKEIDDLERQAAEAMLLIVKDHIQRQDLKWKKLSSAYLAYKKREGLDTRTWIATGELEYLLGVYKDPKNGYYVGGAPGEIHKGSGLEVNHLIQIHEFGSPKTGTPARPLFRPSAKEFRTYIETDLTAEVNRLMHENWKKLMKRMSKYA